MNAKTLLAKFAAAPTVGKASAFRVDGDEAFSYAMKIGKVDRVLSVAWVVESGVRSVTTSKHCNSLANSLSSAGYRVERVESL